MDTNRRLQERGQALAQAARDARQEALGGERLAQETTGGWAGRLVDG